MFSLFRRKKKAQPPIVINNVDEEYIEDFLLQWSLKFPVDKWWRNKHKVPFNSTRHREMSFIDMRFEWEEDQLFNRTERLQDYTPNKGDWMKQEVITEDDSNLTEAERIEKYKKEFESIDLSQYTK